MSRSKPDFNISVKLGRQDGKPVAEVTSRQFANSPLEAQKFNQALQEVVQKLQSQLERTYAPEGLHDSGKGGRGK